MNYKEELFKALKLLSLDDRTIFIGQGAKYSGSPMFEAVADISANKRIEMPVAEDMQTGIAIGLSLKGFIPISMYPRMDFLMRSADQLVNHLDKINQISHGEFKPKIILRVAVGSIKPLYPGEQHCQDHTDAMICLLKNVDIIRLLQSGQIVNEYLRALNNNKSTMLIEYTSKIRGYDE